jgi:quinol monooxygenase YgiN
MLSTLPDGVPRNTARVDAGYGLHAHIEAVEGKADDLEALLLEAAAALGDNPDCLLYLVSRSPGLPDAVLVTELWTSKEAHDASLQDERTREQIARGRPMIASFRADELRPAGGKTGDGRP